MSEPALGLLMLSLIVVVIMMGFPTAFTLMGLGIFFGFVHYLIHPATETGGCSGNYAPPELQWQRRERGKAADVALAEERAIAVQRGDSTDAVIGQRQMLPNASHDRTAARESEVVDLRFGPVEVTGMIEGGQAPQKILRRAVGKQSEQLRRTKKAVAAEIADDGKIIRCYWIRIGLLNQLQYFFCCKWDHIELLIFNRY